MSHYTYAGEYRNPTEGWYVKAVKNHFEVWLHFDRASDGSAKKDRRHTIAPKFNEAFDAEEWIEDKREFFEEDFGDYLEENHFEIAQAERHEAFLMER